jgi:hypothetical protein
MNKLYAFHLVENSPWPFLTSISVLVLTVSGVLYMKGFKYGLILLYVGLILMLLSFFLWFRDVVREATYQGHHTIKVRKGIQLGMILFILSEVLFFVAFFWAYFHSSLTPAVELGAIWPPLGINILNPWNVPLLNTILLLSSGVCQKCNQLDLILTESNSLNFQFMIYLLPFSSPRVLSNKRIGPHNWNILSILICSMLGDGSMERDGNGSRFAFYQEKIHGEYLLWLHRTIFTLGYCKHEIPQIKTRTNDQGDIRYIYRFRTYTYSSFNWIYDSFYPNKKKIIPPLIEEYLSPIGLAIWIMDDGCKYKDKGLKFATNGFSLNEVKFLAELLEKKYGLKTSIHKTGAINQYNIYVVKSSMNKLIEIVKPHIHQSMLYKLGE